VALGEREWEIGNSEEKEWNCGGENSDAQ